MVGPSGASGGGVDDRPRLHRPWRRWSRRRSANPTGRGAEPKVRTTSSVPGRAGRLDGDRSRRSRGRPRRASSPRIQGDRRRQRGRGGQPFLEHHVGGQGALLGEDDRLRGLDRRPGSGSPWASPIKLQVGDLERGFGRGRDGQGFPTACPALTIPGRIVRPGGGLATVSLIGPLNPCLVTVTATVAVPPLGMLSWSSTGATCERAPAFAGLDGQAVGVAVAPFAPQVAEGQRDLRHPGGRR